MQAYLGRPRVQDRWRMRRACPGTGHRMQPAHLGKSRRRAKVKPQMLTRAGDLIAVWTVCRLWACLRRKTVVHPTYSGRRRGRRDRRSHRTWIQGCGHATTRGKEEEGVAQARALGEEHAAPGPTREPSDVYASSSRPRQRQHGGDHARRRGHTAPCQLRTCDAPLVL
jgi:hypothetical protein